MLASSQHVLPLKPLQKPLVTAVSGLQPLTDFPTAMSTDGGTGILLSGLNFGPASLFGADVTSAVTFTYGYSLADPASLVYTASGCKKSSAAPHTTISCYSVGGVGANLVATLAVSGVSGSVATTNLTSLAYAQPTVVRITGAGSTKASTAGGGLITVEGTGFGPAAQNGVVTLTSGTPGWQRGAGGLTYGWYAAAGCTVLSSTPLTCLSVQGTGAGYAWALTIAGQTVRMAALLATKSAITLFTYCRRPSIPPSCHMVHPCCTRSLALVPAV